jgi:hypothetical protein
MEQERFDQVYSVVQNFGKNVDSKTFLSNYVGNFKSSEIEKLRDQFRAEEVQKV